MKYIIYKKFGRLHSKPIDLYGFALGIWTKYGKYEGFRQVPVS